MEIEKEMSADLSYLISIPEWMRGVSLIQAEFTFAVAAIAELFPDKKVYSGFWFNLSFYSEIEFVAGFFFEGVKICAIGYKVADVVGFEESLSLPREDLREHLLKRLHEHLAKEESELVGLRSRIPAPEEQK